MFSDRLAVVQLYVTEQLARACSLNTIVNVERGQCVHVSQIHPSLYVTLLLLLHDCTVSRLCLHVTVNNCS